MTALWQDLRFGFRSLRKNPGFAAIAIFTLALGIGATSAIWSVVDSVLLHPFPYISPERLAVPSLAGPDEIYIASFPVPVFLAFEKQNHSFEDMIGRAYLDVRYKGRSRTEQFQGMWVTPNTFEFLGIKPLLGRPITPEDSKTGAPPVFAMSYPLWTKLFNRDPNILGKVLTLNDTRELLWRSCPRGSSSVAARCGFHSTSTRTLSSLDLGVQPNEVHAVARLKSGVNLQTASVDLQVIAKQFETQYPAWFRTNFKTLVTSLKDDYVGDFEGTVWAMMGAVCLLLLIACSNVAHLLLARATAREKEIAIRISVGATRSQLVRQLLVETGLLIIAACTAGCLLAFWGLRAVAAAIPPDAMPQEVVISLRPAALLFAVLVSAVTGLLCGLAPALHGASLDVNTSLARSGKGGGVPHKRLPSGLVVAEVALSIVLLVGAGLMLRSVFALERVDIGVDPAKIAYAYLSIPEGRYDTAPQKALYFRKLVDRLTALPGVIAATEATSVPPYSFGWTEVLIPGKDHSGSWGATFDMCGEGYFDTLDRHLLQGRLLSRSDVDTARHVVVVNQTFARSYFGSESPIGHSMRLISFEDWAADWPGNASFEIIGVLEDAKNHGLVDSPRPELYFPHTVSGSGSRSVLLRTAGSAASILPTVQREIAAVDSEVIVTGSGSLQSFLNRGYYSGPRFAFIVLGTFAGIALLLVLVGVRLRCKPTRSASAWRWVHSTGMYWEWS